MPTCLARIDVGMPKIVFMPETDTKGGQRVVLTIFVKKSKIAPLQGEIIARTPIGSTFISQSVRIFRSPNSQKQNFIILRNFVPKGVFIQVTVLLNLAAEFAKMKYQDFQKCAYLPCKN